MMKMPSCSDLTLRLPAAVRAVIYSIDRDIDEKGQDDEGGLWVEFNTDANREAALVVFRCACEAWTERGGAGRLFGAHYFPSGDHSPRALLVIAAPEHARFVPPGNIEAWFINSPVA